VPRKKKKKLGKLHTLPTELRRDFATDQRL
jgi:hypothetical protein